MSDKEIDNRTFLGSVFMIMVVMLLLWSAAMYNPPVEHDEHFTFYVASNLTGYNVTIEIYVVALEHGGSADIALNTTNTTSGGWDYIVFNLTHDEQANLTVWWYGNARTVTVFAVYTLELEEYDYEVTNRIMIDEDVGYVDVLM